MRRLYLWALLTLSVLVLCSCHGRRNLEPFVMPEELDTSKNYEITFWAKNDTNKAQTDIYEKAIVDFEALYPNINVNLRLYTDYNRIYNDVITNISTGTTPNVCITYPDHIATYMTGVNTVVPLDGLFEDEKYGLGGSQLRFDAPSREEIIPQFLSECILEGQHYALPFMRSTEALYINKTYVEKMGYTVPEKVTWDFLWEVSEAALEKDSDGNYKVNGQKVMIPFIYKSTDNMMIQWLFQNEAGYSDSDGGIYLFNDTARALLDKVAVHAASGAFSTFKISSYPGNFLNAGQCIFAIDSTAGASWLGSDAPLSDISKESLVEFETLVTTIPQANPEKPKMISQGPSVCIFNKEDPQEVLASWLFMQFLLTNEVQIAYSQTEGYVPVTSKAREAAEYTDYLSRAGEDNSTYYKVKIDASRLLLENVDNTFVTPVFNGSASLRNASGQMIENVAKSVRRKQVVDDEYYDKLYSEMISLFRLSETGSTTIEKHELGALPLGARLLIGGLAIVWILLGLYALSEHIKNRRRNSQKG